MAAGTEPADAVLAFNKAVTERQMEAITGLIAPGAVQFQLKAPHAGLAQGESLTTDMAAHWRTVGALLFSVTKSYRRSAKITGSSVDGSLATVWANVSTESVEKTGRARSQQFSEVYLLVRVGDEWKIGAVADNRHGSDIGMATQAPDGDDKPQRPAGPVP
jgi:ketosteroid isomerase-like protein